VKADTLAKQILFSTVRITNALQGGQGASVGTGFLFNAAPSTADPIIPLLITNKHVVDSAAEIRLDFLVENADSSGPALGLCYQHIITGTPEVGYFGHPNPKVDVAVIPLADAWNQLWQLKPHPFVRLLDWNLLPTAQAITEFDAIEELTFVGYPNGLADPVNHIPIARQAITATPLAIPFGGDPAFLLDGAVFGGSSGSPVFVLNRDTWRSTDGTLNLGSRLFLVGVIALTWDRQNDVPVQVSSPAIPFVRISQSLNLGVAFSSQAIVETINYVLRTYNIPEGMGLQEHG
jgi:hypothetical protein